MTTTNKTLVNKTQGQRFAKCACSYFSVGPRTLRYRDGVNLVDRIRTEVYNGACNRGYFSDIVSQGLDPAFHTLTAWEKHVECRRLSSDLLEVLLQVRPYQFVKLIGDMIDDGVTNSAEAERWFREHRQSILAMRKAVTA